MATASDLFNRTDESPLAGNWETSESPGLRIVSNQVNGSGVPHAGSNWKSSVNNFGDDQYSEAAILLAGAYDNASVTVRCTGTTSYRAMVNAENGWVYLWKRVAGVDTYLTGINNGGWTSGHVLKLTATTAGANCNLAVFINGASSFTFSDTTSPITGGQPGLGYENGNAAVTQIDSWAGGDLSAGASVAPLAANYYYMGA